METRNVISSRKGAIFLVLSFLFTLGMFCRVSIAVIAPNLIADLSLNAETIGVLGSGLFYAFAFMQIPIGPLLDRIGPQIIIPLFSLIAATGVFLFAFAPSYNVALTARILMGIGTAPLLMGAFKIFTMAFPSNSFATLSGLMLSIGMIGNIFATSPLAYLAAHMGWRKVFFATGVASATLGILSFFILRKKLSNRKKPPEKSFVWRTMNLAQSSRLIISSLSFWQIATMAFFRYGTFASIQGLWFGLYLMDVKQFSPVDAGHILIMLSLGNIVGAPVAGRLSDCSSQGTKAVTMAGMAMYCVSLLPLTGFWSINSRVIFMLVSFFMGFFNGFGSMLYTHAKELFPLHIAGTVMSWVNFFFMLGSAVLMSVFGKLIELSPHAGRSYSPKAYELCFLICLLSMTASVVFYAFSKRRYND